MLEGVWSRLRRAAMSAKERENKKNARKLVKQEQAKKKLVAKQRVKQERATQKAAKKKPAQQKKAVSKPPKQQYGKKKTQLSEFQRLVATFSSEEQNCFVNISNSWISISCCPKNGSCPCSMILSRESSIICKKAVRWRKP